MLLTIEKVAVLRGVDLFKDIPGFVLAAVAQVMTPVYLEPGENIIRQGEVEQCMYIVVEGEVRVHAGDTTLMKLGQNETVGELAVLDPEPRAASVTAVGEAVLFRLDKAALDEVMADRPEMAQGIIRALCQRIRYQGRLMAQNS